MTAMYIVAFIVYTVIFITKNKVVKLIGFPIGTTWLIALNYAELIYEHSYHNIIFGVIFTVLLFVWIDLKKKEYELLNL